MQAASGQHRVLIVDDQPEIRESLAEVLDDEGFSVQTAANGREALERARSARPSLILLDLMMPVMDGWEFARELAADPELAGVPFLVVSGADDVPGVAAALGAAGYLKKPLDVDRLLHLVHAYC